MRRMGATVCAVVLMAAACDRASTTSGGDEAETAGAGRKGPAPVPTNKTKAAGPADAGVKPARPPAVDMDKEVRILLDAWTSAQNNGLFDSYAGLYADKFTGVKRVEDRVYRFNRAGWLEDRQRMFRKSMSVSIDSLQITATSSEARAEFVQRWSSGRFEDVGPKRMLIVRGKTGLEIAQEEMLQSTRVLPDGNMAVGGAVTLEQLGFLLKIEDTPYLVLDGVVVPDHGKPRLIDGDPLELVAPIKPGDVTPELAKWKGKKLRGGDGCEATVVGFDVIGRVVPHFGTVQEWSCQYQEDGCVPATPAERAEQAMAMAQTMVGARLDGCADQRHARLASLPAQVVGTKVSDPALEAKAVAAFARLPEVTALETSEGETHRGWWKKLEKVDIFEHPVSHKRLVSVRAATDSGAGCGEFLASAWQVWEVSDGKLVPLYDASAPLDVLEAVDGDGDGNLELLVAGDHFGQQLALVDVKRRETHRELKFAYNDCPC